MKDSITNSGKVLYLKTKRDANPVIFHFWVKDRLNRLKHNIDQIKKWSNVMIVFGQPSPDKYIIMFKLPKDL